MSYANAGIIARLVSWAAPAVALAVTPAISQELDEVTAGTSWLAQAEHGGFYQALADGTYEKYGLKVTIMMGGPSAPNTARLIAGQIDFLQGGTLGAFDYVAQKVPTLAVAGMFQKDPISLLTHPEKGFNDLGDLASLKTIYLSGSGYDTFWRWMKAKYEGFDDSLYAPYNYNPGPFLADLDAAQQSYVTSEPFDIANKAGWEPKAFIFADYGYNGYANEIHTQQKLVDENPDLVQRFVDATAIGWYNYLYGDSTAANELMKKDNPEMTDEQIAYSIEAMKKLGIVNSGMALEKGVGCVTADRYALFFEDMVEAGVLDAGLDYKKAFDTRFTCKGVGMDLYPDAVSSSTD
ncbi:MAG: ABC transporter substrate-binding protein [Rhizobiaceae bacterium]